MKKLISIVLTAILLASATAVQAESALDYTPKDVLQWLEENDQYADSLQEIIDSYNAGNEAAETADAQTVNALFTAMKLATLVLKESCTSQDQIDQIDEGLAQCSAENEAAKDMDDQMAVGAKWLRKMLGAFAKLHNPNCTEDINAEMENTENHIASQDMSSKQATFQYLSSSVFALAIFTGNLSMN